MPNRVVLASARCVRCGRFLTDLDAISSAFSWRKKVASVRVFESTGTCFGEL